MPTEIANKIREIRDINNLSQERFAKKIGLSGKTISAYETGRTTPPLRVLNKITEVYDSAYINVDEKSQKSIFDSLKSISNELENLKSIIDRGII